MPHPDWNPETLAVIRGWWRANKSHPLVHELATRGYGGVGGMCSYALECAGDWAPRDVFYGLVDNLERFSPAGPELPPQAAVYLRRRNPGLAGAAAGQVQPVILGCWALGMHLRHARERMRRR